MMWFTQKASTQEASTQAPAPSLLQRTDVHALEMKRDALRNQLQGLTERRVLVGVQLRDAKGTDADRALERVIRELDARTARVNAELDKTDDAITRALDRDISSQDARPVIVGPGGPAIIAEPGEMPVIQVPPFHFDGFNASEMMRNFVVFEGIQLLLIGFVAWRWMRARPATTARLAPEDSGRIDQLQRAVDVIAVEVERISEGQRFVNKALSVGGPEHAKNALPGAGTR